MFKSTKIKNLIFIFITFTLLFFNKKLKRTDFFIDFAFFKQFKPYISEPLILEESNIEKGIRSLLQTSFNGELDYTLFSIVTEKNELQKVKFSFSFFSLKNISEIEVFSKKLANSIFDHFKTSCDFVEFFPNNVINENNIEFNAGFFVRSNNNTGSLLEYRNNRTTDTTLYNCNTLFCSNSKFTCFYNLPNGNDGKFSFYVN